MEAASAMKAASVKTTKAGLSSDRVASGEPTMREPSEGARVHAGWATRTAGTIKPLAPGEIPARIDAPIKTGTPRVKTVAVDDRAAMRDVGVVVVDHPSVMVPIEIPMVPSPT